MTKPSIDFMSMPIGEIVYKANQMSVVDKRYQDIAHQIELIPMDAVMLSKKVKELKEIMIERRLVKECMFFLANLDKLGSVKSTIDRIDWSISKCEERRSKYIKESMESYNEAILS